MLPFYCKPLATPFIFIFQQTFSREYEGILAFFRDSFQVKKYFVG
jgi:hypothetical protein